MENKQSVTGLSRHALLMVVCCAVPLALFAAVSFFRIDLGGVGYWALLLLCPLMHLFMMRGMHGNGAEKSCHAEGQETPAVVLPPQGERTKIPVSLER